MPSADPERHVERPAVTAPGYVQRSAPVQASGRDSDAAERVDPWGLPCLASRSGRSADSSPPTRAAAGEHSCICSFSWRPYRGPWPQCRVSFYGRPAYAPSDLGPTRRSFDRTRDETGQCPANRHSRPGEVPGPDSAKPKPSCRSAHGRMERHVIRRYPTGLGTSRTTQRKRIARLCPPAA